MFEMDYSICIIVLLCMMKVGRRGTSQCRKMRKAEEEVPQFSSVLRVHCVDVLISKLILKKIFINFLQKNKFFNQNIGY